MAKFDKIAVLTKMGAMGMTPVFYHEDVEMAKKVLKACYEDGARTLEFTNRGDFAWGMPVGIVKLAARECPEIATDAGSIVDPATTTLYIQLGANFVVEPLLNPGIAKICSRRLIVYTPGCGSISEAGFTQEAGYDLRKILPGGVYGPNFIKGLMAPMSWSKLMVTGGMEPTRESPTSWSRAGAFYVGMGSRLFPKDKVTAGDWGYVTGKRTETSAYTAEVGKQVKFSGVLFITDYTDSYRFLIVLIHKISH